MDAGYCGRCSSSCKTDIRQPSFEVMPRISVLFGVTVDCLLCRGQALSGHLCPQRPGGPGGLRYDGNPETTISLFERKVVDFMRQSKICNDYVMVTSKGSLCASPSVLGMFRELPHQRVRLVRNDILFLTCFFSSNAVLIGAAFSLFW